MLGDSGCVRQQVLAGWLGGGGQIVKRMDGGHIHPNCGVKNWFITFFARARNPLASSLQPPASTIKMALNAIQ